MVIYGIFPLKTNKQTKTTYWMYVLLYVIINAYIVLLFISDCIQYQIQKNSETVRVLSVLKNKRSSTKITLSNSIHRKNHCSTQYEFCLILSPSLTCKNKSDSIWNNCQYILMIFIFKIYLLSSPTTVDLKYKKARQKIRKTHTVQ